MVFLATNVLFLIPISTVSSFSLVHREVQTYMAEFTEINCCSCSNGYLDLPPGFRFHPTDEEIIINYLREKVLNPSFSSIAIGEVDLNKCEPWDLPSNAKMGEKVCYFFCQRDRKYPTGIRTNRATEAGFWKATGKDKEICKGREVLIGMKKTLVFYQGRAPKGKKTNWVMHEYRLEGESSLTKSIKDSWVVCRVFHKNQTMKIKSSMPELVDSPASSTFNQNLDQDESLILQNNNQFMNSYIVPTQTDPPQNQCLNSTSSMMNTEYLHQEQGNFIIGEPTDLKMQCNKLEQLSSQSMITASHDALLSPETNTEISSLNLDNNFNSNWFFNYPEVNPYQDLDNIWNY